MATTPPAAADLLKPFAHYGEVEARPLTRFQQIVAKRLTQNAQSIPHVTHHDEVDVTAVEEARKRIGGEVKVTGLIFVIKAMVAAMRAYPTFNASLAADGTTLVFKKYFHVGVAVDGPLGLLVPVIRDCDGKSLSEIAAELAAVSEQARGKGLPMEAMSGASMSVSSLGGIGGTAFTPIINAPEVAILGVTRTQWKPVWDGQAFQPRQLLPLSLSYDHRVINGADAARFLRRMGEELARLAAEIG